MIAAPGRVTRWTDRMAGSRIRRNSTGKATKVALAKHPNIETAKAVAYVLVRAKYKPAVCAGQPCTMDFPFRVVLRHQ